MNQHMAIKHHDCHLLRFIYGFETASCELTRNLRHPFEMMVYSVEHCKLLNLFGLRDSSSVVMFDGLQIENIASRRMRRTHVDDVYLIQITYSISMLYLCYIIFNDVHCY